MPAYRESYVFRIETDDPASFWTGHGPLLLPADAVLPENTIFSGMGQLVEIPDLQQIINGTAQRLDVSLSGVNEETIVFATEEALQIPGALVWIGRVQFDDAWQVSAVEWEWCGEGVKLTVDSDGSNGDRVRSIKLTVAAGETSRRRAPNAYFTDADQQRDYPGDTFFSHVAQISRGVVRRWGPV
ncbi:hypothetical protein GTZ99_12485 [Novosphingobium sp. FSY-8]|uniref:Uncharacterized protein n=1 Tax=Novosphingobium ovatum TaxID=1908523 RepID=A0ABW9XFP7_9SPHN|nr:hypothetical protein [Novosphingobium ovatum]NBC37368.1 hypothetical protein [Novosphingobium ovatum]